MYLYLKNYCAAEYNFLTKLNKDTKFNQLTYKIVFKTFEFEAMFDDVLHNI